MQLFPILLEHGSLNFVGWHLFVDLQVQEQQLPHLYQPWFCKKMSTVTYGCEDQLIM